jgi:hypothetical protein
MTPSTYVVLTVPYNLPSGGVAAVVQTARV